MAVYFYGCISMDGYLATRSHDLAWLYETGTPEETGCGARTLFNLLKLAIPGGCLLPEASCGLGAVRNSFIWHGWYRISLCARIPARVRKGTGAASSVPSYFSPTK